jgi:hypothetical protein
MAVEYNPRIVTDGLVLCLDAANPKSYPGSGVTWSDLSRSGNHATFVNGTSFSSTNNGIISFDGTNDYVRLTPGVFGAVNPSTFTISIWFKTTSGGVLLSHASTDPPNINGDAVAGMYVDSNGKLVTACWYDGVGNIAGTSTTNVNDGKWHNATVTCQALGVFNTTHISYIDGIVFDSRNRSTVGISSTTGYFLCGGRFFGFIYPNWPASNYLNCQLSDITLYNRVLSSFEIQQNFNALRGRFGI